MIDFRCDDGLLICIAGSLFQVGITTLDALENAKVIPFGPSCMREMFRTKRLRWIILAVPLVVIYSLGMWFCLRLVMPENLWISGGIFLALFILTTGMNIAKIRSLNMTAKAQRQVAVEHLSKAESHLKRLAEGPMIVDEELDLKVLQLRKTIAEARDRLGVEENDPNSQ